MARKQTRRSISINCLNYEVIQKAATSREMTVAGLVEFALGAIGVPVVVHTQQTRALAGSIAARKGEGVCSRRSVSVNRSNYEAAKQVAASRGVSIARLVGQALNAVGVLAGPPVQQLPAPAGAFSEGAIPTQDSSSAEEMSV